MSLQRTDALQAIYNAIEEMNPQLKPERQLQAAEDAVIYGESAPLDSLDLVNLIMAVEQHIMDLTGDELVLASAVLIALWAPLQITQSNLPASQPLNVQ